MSPIPLRVEADRQDAEPAFQRLAGTPAHDVDLGAGAGGEVVQQAAQLVIGLGQLRHLREIDEGAVVVEQDDEVAREYVLTFADEAPAGTVVT